MHKHLPLLLALFLFVAGCGDTPPINKANKTFERAWNAFISLMDDKAQEHFDKAADLYAEALAQANPSKTARRPSSRVKAGMSFYYAGRYEECIESMAEAAPSGKLPWEADFYSGLAAARLGDRQNTVKHLTQFAQGVPPVRVLLTLVKTQIATLDNGEDLDQSADILEKGVQAQLVSTIKVTNGRRTITPHAERCDGAFWWRQNKKPCNDSRDK